MRFILLIGAVLASLPSVVRAEPLRIETVDAFYWQDADEFVITVTFDRAFDLKEDWINLSLIRQHGHYDPPNDVWPNEEWLGFGRINGDSYMGTYTWTIGDSSEPNDIFDIGPFSATFTDRHFTTKLPLDALLFNDSTVGPPHRGTGVSTRTFLNVATPAFGTQVDVMTHVPEPSALGLASFGILLLGFRLSRNSGFRQGLLVQESISRYVRPVRATFDCNG